MEIGSQNTLNERFIQKYVRPPDFNIIASEKKSGLEDDPFLFGIAAFQGANC